MIQKMLLGALFIFPVWAIAQFSDNFSDGNYTSNPTWNGTAADWIINTDLQLQSNNTTLNSNFYISTPNTKATIAQWDFWVKLAFNTSGANYVDVYLTASQSNLTLANTTGYFVRLGDTPDEISLYRKDGSGASQKIIDGADGILNNSNNIVRIRVIRDANNNWSLQRDFGATGTYVSEGSVVDANYTTSSFFGIWIRQSTASFVQKHFFDDFEITNYAPDLTPPSIVSANAISGNVLEVLFNEPLQAASAISLLNYSVNNGIGNPVSAVADFSNPLLIRLTFANAFANGMTNTLTINGVKDLAGNAVTNANIPFSFFKPQRYDIVIHELMADPSPAVGLPIANWIELKNTSGFPINLSGYRLARSAGVSGPFPSFVLGADSLVIVCTGSQVPNLQPFGTTISVTSFPSLPIGGDLVWLQDAAGSLMHSVEYNPSWYQNAVKADGGWSLEMIDAKNPCQGAENWKASVHPLGGTPGKTNSIAAVNKDVTAPYLVQAYANNANTITLSFNETLDSSFSAAATYSLSNGIGAPNKVVIISPSFRQVQLSFTNPMQAGTLYTITATGLKDCSGNTSISGTAKVGLPQTADSFDLVINELLFNPVPLQADYLELYNRSNKILDATRILFTNRSSTTGNLGTFYPLSNTGKLIFPGDFYVVTEDSLLIGQKYLVQNKSFLNQVSTMPSYPDDKGTVVILTNTGKIIDELAYNQNWHFALIDNNEGISLERIDYEKATQQKDNWTSAAASAGFGTPTYQNSQFRQSITAPAGSIRLNPALFSPDNDGFEDFTLIEFEMNEPGYVANVTIFDGAGRPVRILQRNTTIAARGSFRWDGLNDKQQKVPAGNYAVFFEIFNLKGEKQAFKKGVTVAKRF